MRGCSWPGGGLHLHSDFGRSDSGRKRVDSGGSAGEPEPELFCLPACSKLQRRIRLEHRRCNK